MNDKPQDDAKAKRRAAANAAAAAARRKQVVIDRQSRLRLWNRLYIAKTEEFYVELYLEKMSLIDRSISGFLAFASTASVATWAVWKEHATIWAGIVAASQTLNAVKSFLPYNARRRALEKLSATMSSITVDIENDWRLVESRKIKGATILNKANDAAKKIATAKRSAFGGVTLPVDKDIHQRAQAAATQYVKNL